MAGVSTRIVTRFGRSRAYKARQIEERVRCRDQKSHPESQKEEDRRGEQAITMSERDRQECGRDDRVEIVLRAETEARVYPGYDGEGRGPRGGRRHYEIGNREQREEAPEDVDAEIEVR